MKSVVEKCCEGVLWGRVVGKCCEGVLWRSVVVKGCRRDVVEQCWRTLL